AIFLAALFIFHAPERSEDVGLAKRAVNFSGKHADDGEGLAVENHLLADHIGIARKAALPETFAEENYFRSTDFIFVGRKRATENGSEAKRGCESGGDAAHAEAVRFLLAGPDDIVVLIRADTFEDLILRLPVAEIRHGDAHLGNLLGPFAEKDETIGSRIRK